MSCCREAMNIFWLWRDNLLLLFKSFGCVHGSNDAYVCAFVRKCVRTYEVVRALSTFRPIDYYYYYSQILTCALYIARGWSIYGGRMYVCIFYWVKPGWYLRCSYLGVLGSIDCRQSSIITTQANLECHAGDSSAILSILVRAAIAHTVSRAARLRRDYFYLYHFAPTSTWCRASHYGERVIGTALVTVATYYYYYL